MTLIKILQLINIIITMLFLAAYIYRIVHLRHFAITDQYIKRYPMPRIILCMVYMALSVGFLITTAVMGSAGRDAWIIQFGVGECVDSIILIIMLIVLKLELNKERPYTPIHLLFCLYLSLICLIRTIINIIIQFENSTAQTAVFTAFYVAFLINAILLLGYWIAKRQELPEFQNHDYFNFDQFKEYNNASNINRNIQISYLRKTSETFGYIRPSVSVEQDMFRIVLEVPVGDDGDKVSLPDNDNLANNANNNSNKKASMRKQFKIISNKLYSTHQLLQLYKTCGRFSINQKLNFASPNLTDVNYKSLQNYLDQLFSTKKHYLKFMLKFFNVPEEYIEACQKSLRDSFKDTEFDIYSNMDKNASIVSIRVFKHLWVDDYYLFYMDVVAVDGRFESRPMRRYNDFQMFHNQITNIIKRKYGGKYTLPNLPKKYLFNKDQSKISQRRNELQIYLRSLTNDYKFMLQLHEVRQATLQFLDFFDLVALQPVNQSFINFFKNIEVFKGSISKQICGSQYVTFYQFKILYNGIPIRGFKKRFSQFAQLHQTIQRWMTNTQISYKFLILPEKHLYKSGQDRHQKLRHYLQLLTKIQDIWKVYEVNAFFEVGSNKMRDISMSRISSKDQESEKNRKLGINQDEDLQTQRFIDQESFQSKGRMSALIQQLGSNY